MNARRRRALRLEVLETRFTPAVTVVNNHLATFTDVDGDHVSITVSKGDLHDVDFVTAPAGVGEQLQTLDLLDGSIVGADLTIRATRAAGGDGLVNVGYVQSTFGSLGVVTVAGDLGRIDAKESVANGVALKALNVRSIGRYGCDTQGNGTANLTSNIVGTLGALNVTGDLVDAYISVVSGDIGPVTIGGSLVGGWSSAAGKILCDGEIGPVKIGHDLVGGAGDQAGFIRSNSTMGSVKIGGSIFGGSGFDSGEVFSHGDMGAVKVGRDVIGGIDSQSGRIAGDAGSAGVTVGGSLIGGSGLHSGQISFKTDVGAIKVGHNIQGSSGTGSGEITILGNATSVTVGGSLIGGSAPRIADDGSGMIFVVHLGTARVAQNVQGGAGPLSGLINTGSVSTVMVGGSIIGGSGSNSGEVAADGNLPGVLTNVSVGGSLIGGSASFTGVVSGNKLGHVKIGRDLLGGSLATGGANLDGSGLIEGASIANVTVGGSVISGADHSTSGTLLRNASIAAQGSIGSVTVKGSLVGNRALDDTPVVIRALGQFSVAADATTDLAIGKITIGGRVELTRILAGYGGGQDANHNFIFVPSNADAQIGSVTVAGDWIASSIVAGVQTTSAGGFGTSNDSKIIDPGTTDRTGVISKIGSMAIGGQALGTPDSYDSGDHFGFVAQQIDSVKIGGQKIAVTAGPGSVSIGLTNDLTVLQVAL